MNGIFSHAILPSLLTATKMAYPLAAAINVLFCGAPLSATVYKGPHTHTVILSGEQRIPAGLPLFQRYRFSARYMLGAGGPG